LAFFFVARRASVNFLSRHVAYLPQTALVHRVKLRDAIAALLGDTSSATPSNGAAATPAAASLSPEDRAERRQVTVMFSDLVGPTALWARMDPEDLREVISAYQKCVVEAVQRFGGFVAKYMGGSSSTSAVPNPRGRRQRPVRAFRLSPAVIVGGSLTCVLIPAMPARPHLRSSRQRPLVASQPRHDGENHATSQFTLITVNAASSPMVTMRMVDRASAQERNHE
jgi:class 3 adenylate cyclase